MKDFIAKPYKALLEAHQLASFEALWALQLKAVDEPNTGRGGWSSVYRLVLDGQAFYLKRQTNHLTRSLYKPLGEPTFAREFRNILAYQQKNIPALEAAFFAERKVGTERRAILLTRALDDYQDLASYLPNWPSLAQSQKTALLKACGTLAATLHKAGQMHGCLYPKHIFLKPAGHAYQGALIDLEKTRPLYFGERDRIKDLETLVRRAQIWSQEDCQVFLTSYLGESGIRVEQWYAKLSQRLDRKGARV